MAEGWIADTYANEALAFVLFYPDAVDGDHPPRRGRVEAVPHLLPADAARKRDPHESYARPVRRWSRLVASLPVALLALVACSSESPAESSPTTSPGEARSTDEAASILRLPALHAEPDVIDGGRIVDAEGREVLLRGVNVNALAEYWSGNEFPTTFPLTDADIDLMAGIGWDVVRLLVSWSRIEPEPGRYDEEYLAEVDDAIDRLAARGLYTIVDLHQDAWGPTLAARPDEGCAPDQEPSRGWDGAPGWATLGGEERGTRCTVAGVRETSAAVMASFDAFFADSPGPGGVGIRTRYVAMLSVLAGRWADRAEVAGYDVMNEPNAFSAEGRAALADLYGDAIVAIRDGEAAAGGDIAHLVLFEPPAIWSSTGEGAPPDFPHDDQIVYAPHIYTGGFTGGPITIDAFEQALTEAAGFGGAPVLSGEWGADPARAGPGGDGYFLDHQRLQDETGISATLWTWRESCGDPHKVGQEDPVPWGEFEVDCTTNEPTGRREDLIDELTRGYVRAAPGLLEATSWDPDTRVLTASGSEAEPGTELVAFVPGDAADLEVTAKGLADARLVPAEHGGTLVRGEATDPAWSIEVGPA